jgi:hypothetical protein
VFQRQVFVNNAGYPMIRSQKPPLPLLHPLPDYWVALLHSRLLGRGVLHASSPDPELRIYAHCSKLHDSQQQQWRERSGVDMGAVPSAVGAGDIAIAFLNIGQANLTISFSRWWEGPLTRGPDSWTVWVLTSGERIAGAPNPLQSRDTMLNGQTLALREGGKLPSMAGRASAGAETLVIPPTSYGFAVLHGVAAQACDAYVGH